MRALVTGWFSFPDMGTTAGDIISKDIVCDWLREGAVPFDVAVDQRFETSGVVNWREVPADVYTDLIFVCGPFGNGWPVTELLDKFRHCRLTGVNLSLLQKLSQWNPFHFIMERDHDNVALPDLTFAGAARRVPLVGVILVHKQKEYGARALHEQADQLIQGLISSMEMSVVEIDTSLGNNKGGLRTPAEVESLIAGMDVIVTTRLHGTVLALKNGVPVVPVDPIKGGAKISLQVNALKWPLLYQLPETSVDDLIRGFNYCLTPEAEAVARSCAESARSIIEKRKANFLQNFSLLVSTDVNPSSASTHR